MKNQSVVLCNNTLQATVRLPGGGQESQRFDAAAVVEQVVLHGRHRFCQPEQKYAGRRTCHGVGLCGEFVWNELADEASAGELFPKLGVGLMTQCRQGGPYDMWKHYEVNPFETESVVFGNRIEFVQHPVLCLGIAARIHKSVEIRGNALSVTTTIENTGERVLDLFEYQHNFVALDDIPIGPGYTLDIPFDETICEISEAAKKLGDETPLEGVLRAQGQTIHFDRQFDDMFFHKTTPEDKIKTLPLYRWTLGHSDTPASVSETCHFAPSRLVLWGNENNICAEVYVKIHIEPGKRQTFARTWHFEDSET